MGEWGNNGHPQSIWKTVVYNDVKCFHNSEMFSEVVRLL
jgi:hypothetical protein